MIRSSRTLLRPEISSNLSFPRMSKLSSSSSRFCPFCFCVTKGPECLLHEDPRFFIHHILLSFQSQVLQSEAFSWNPGLPAGAVGFPANCQVLWGINSLWQSSWWKSRASGEDLIDNSGREGNYWQVVEEDRRWIIIFFFIAWHAKLNYISQATSKQS